jgi:hypothetical protein
LSADRVTLQKMRCLNLEGLGKKKYKIMNDLVPSEFYLSQNYPNPFRDTTTIKFCVAYRTKVKLEVFNSEGEMIKTLLDEEKEAGTYGIEFDARGLAEGDYINQLHAGDFLSRKKMTLLR